MRTAPRILLGQLGANGDCLYATAVARQIKTDFPSCHLTWAVGSLFRHVLDGNPFIDAIWEIPLSSRIELENTWRRFAPEARARRERGEFDEVYLTQINPENYGNFDMTVRASIFRSYPRPITVPVAPVVRLREDEVDNATRFAARHGLDRYEHRILFECMAASSQSFLTPAFATEAAQLVLDRVPDTAFILSSTLPVTSTDPRIIDGSVMRFRENAEITRHCTLFIGGSSGLTWLATSDWAAPLPMIQLLSRETSVYASVVHDAEYFGLPTEHILEMTDCTPRHLADCIVVTLTRNLAAARRVFHEQIPVRLDFYMSTIIWSLVKAFRFRDVVRSWGCVARRYGPGPFLRFAATAPARLFTNLDREIRNFRG